jgi:hypothetical protein
MQPLLMHAVLSPLAPFAARMRVSVAQEIACVSQLGAGHTTHAFSVSNALSWLSPGLQHQPPYQYRARGCDGGITPHGDTEGGAGAGGGGVGWGVWGVWGGGGGGGGLVGDDDTKQWQPVCAPRTRLEAGERL